MITMATTAEYWQRGEALDYTNSTDSTIPANTIVQIGSRIGVTGCSIAPGDTGSLHVGGVWEIPKTGTDAIEMGTTVYFDGTGITSTEKDAVEVGYAAAPATADATSILVKLRG
jgi:predicted RecA/RadA family phage recombinase